MPRNSFRDRVRFDRPVTTKDAGGGRTGSWTEITTEFCNIERLQSFRFDVEREKAGSVSSMPLVRIHVHKNPSTLSIDNSCRAVDLDSGKAMNINYVQDLEGKGSRTLVISASEGAPV